MNPEKNRVDNFICENLRMLAQQKSIKESSPDHIKKINSTLKNLKERDMTWTDLQREVLNKCFRQIVSECYDEKEVALALKSKLGIHENNFVLLMYDGERSDFQNLTIAAIGNLIMKSGVPIRLMINCHNEKLGGFY